jgi:hypothetical protein
MAGGGFFFFAGNLKRNFFFQTFLVADPAKTFTAPNSIKRSVITEAKQLQKKKEMII